MCIRDSIEMVLFSTSFFPNIKKAEQMKLKLKKRFSSCKNLEFIICSGKNSGADIQLK